MGERPQVKKRRARHDYCVGGRGMCFDTTTADFTAGATTQKAQRQTGVATSGVTAKTRRCHSGGVGGEWDPQSLTEMERTLESLAAENQRQQQTATT